MNEFTQEHLNTPNSGLNHRSWGEYQDGKPLIGQALAQLLGPFRIEPGQQRMGSHGPVRGYTWADHFDHPVEPVVPIPEAVPVRQTVQRKSSDSRCLA